MKQSNFISRLIVIGLFASFFITGMNSVKDYGLGFDDEIQERHGRVSYDYINKTFGIDKEPIAPNKEQLHEYEHKYYGVAFQLSALYLEKVLGVKSFTDRHMLRHQMVFILFFLASIAFYRILYRQFGNRYLALLGAFLFVFSPRTFGHAFFNIKDSVLLSFFVFGLASFFRYLDNPKVSNALLHAFICGLTVNIRVVGVILPALSIAWLVFYFIAAEDKGLMWNKWKKSLLVFALTTPVFIYIFWPYLWGDPIHNLLESFSAMGKYNWGGLVLLFNVYFFAPEVPWYYAPAWMLLTIPLFYWLLFVLGFAKPVGQWIFSLFKGDISWFRQRENRFIAISFSFFLLPILMVIIKESTLYDGWRQLHFTYVGFLLVAFAGLLKLLRWAKGKSMRRYNLTKLFIGLNLIYLMFLTISIHPHQHTYFNILASGGSQITRFEVDYWGISYRSGLKELAKLAKDGECIKFYSFSYPGEANYEFLDKETKEKLCLKYNANDSDYYITNFRARSERKDFEEKNGCFKNPVILIERLGVPIVGVFKLDK